MVFFREFCPNCNFWRKGQRLLLHEFRRNWMWRKQLHSYLSKYEAWDTFQTMNEVWPQDCGHCLWLQLLAIAASLWLPHSRCNPVSPASNGHQGSYGVVLEEVTRGYVGLPQQNTPSPFCTILSLKSLQTTSAYTLRQKHFLGWDGAILSLGWIPQDWKRTDRKGQALG